MGWQLQMYRMLSRAAPMIAGCILKRRLMRGKEDPDRWREKQGLASVPRPDGPLVWMHAVGLGEVLALRGLITAMQKIDPGLSFLVTSSTRTSAEVFAKACPARTVHQFLPLDVPSYLAAFMDHWQPDLSIWAEQDLWPNAICMAAERRVPLALVNARMSDAAYKRRKPYAGVYRNMLERFALIAAQDASTAANLARFGAVARVTGPLKAAADPLPFDPAEAERWRAMGRHWVLASSHPADEAMAIGADVPGLIIVPRDIGRATQIEGPRRSKGEDPEETYIADTYGELGLWYAVSDVALIGGTFDETEGHNPWEAVGAGCAVLHGPRVGNFASDFEMLHAEAAALEVTESSLRTALQQDHSEMIAKASTLVELARAELRPLATDLCDMVQR